MYDLELWKRRKKTLHLTFDELSVKSNVSISALKNIFRGTTTDPRIETVAAIERALDIVDGITQEEFNAGWRSTKKISITPLEDDAIYALREIGKKYGEETQKAAVTMLENMAGIKKS